MSETVMSRSRKSGAVPTKNQRTQTQQQRYTPASSATVHQGVCGLQRNTLDGLRCREHAHRNQVVALPDLCWGGGQRPVPRGVRGADMQRDVCMSAGPRRGMRGPCTRWSGPLCGALPTSVRVGGQGRPLSAENARQHRCSLPWTPVEHGGGGEWGANMQHVKEAQGSSGAMMPKGPLCRGATEDCHPVGAPECLTQAVCTNAAIIALSTGMGSPSNA